MKGAIYQYILVEHTAHRFALYWCYDLKIGQHCCIKAILARTPKLASSGPDGFHVRVLLRSPDMGSMDEEEAIVLSAQLHNTFVKSCLLPVCNSSKK